MHDPRTLGLGMMDDEAIMAAWQVAFDEHVDQAHVRWRPAPHLLRAFLGALPPRVGDGDAREALLSELKIAIDRFDGARPAVHADLVEVLQLVRRLTTHRFAPEDDPNFCPNCGSSFDERIGIGCNYCEHELTAPAPLVQDGACAVVEQNVPPLSGYRVVVGELVAVPETNSMSALEAAAAINAANGLAPAPLSPQKPDPDEPSIPDPPSGVQDTPADEDGRAPLLERAEEFLVHDEACGVCHDDGPCDCIVLEIRAALASSAPAQDGEAGR